jgi:D-glycero-D-manno-heptose 1,7-bisphosphate phosphatase
MPNMSRANAAVCAKLPEREVMLSWIGSPEAHCRKIVFLDRDGVINQDSPHYIKRWSEFRIYPDALEALRRLHERGICAVLISNQSALHRGIMEWPDFWEIHDRMIEAVRQAGGDLLAAFYCPHRPDENCQCRKPRPGMIEAAATLFGIELDAAFMIGDRETDMMAASRAGCTPLLLERQVEERWGASGAWEGLAKVERFPTLTEAVCALLSA